MRDKDVLGAAKEPAPAGDEGRPGEAAVAGWGASERPLLMVDIDGVISLFAGDARDRGAAEGCFHSIEGIPHFLSAKAAAHLLVLADIYDLVWASGWEERAEENLPHLLGLPAGLPFLRFDRGPATPRRTLQGARAGSLDAHWKLAAVDAYAGGRPVAWIDDALDEACRSWAGARPAPTLLVETEPHTGLTDREAELLRSWAHSLRAA
ncbi:MAG: HAD domain-containing protein [Solirubrobacteraceae bacterium]